MLSGSARSPFASSTCTISAGVDGLTVTSVFSWEEDAAHCNCVDLCYDVVARCTLKGGLPGGPISVHYGGQDLVLDVPSSQACDYYEYAYGVP